MAKLTAKSLIKEGFIPLFDSEIYYKESYCNSTVIRLNVYLKKGGWGGNFCSIEEKEPNGETNEVNLYKYKFETIEDIQLISKLVL
jgi:hypothetical protein